MFPPGARCDRLFLFHFLEVNTMSFQALKNINRGGATTESDKPKNFPVMLEQFKGEIARALLSHPEGSTQDRLNAFLSLAPEVPLGLLGQAWTTLTPECQVDPKFATVFADRLIADHRFSEAASVLLAVPNAARNGAVNRRLAKVLIGSGKREGFDEAQRLIAGEFPDEDPEISAWLDLLESIPPVSLQAKVLAPIGVKVIQDESFYVEPKLTDTEVQS